MWKNTILSSFSANNQIKLLYTKLYQNRIINAEFENKIGNGHNTPIFSSWDYFWKSVKNGQLVLQLIKICSLHTGVFPRIRDLNLLYAQNIWIFIRYHKFFFTIWCNTALFIIWDLVDPKSVENWVIKWNLQIFSRKNNKVGD